MASLSPLLDIKENFFICPVCLDYFREPKSLPCLHRFCKPCLQGIIEEKHGAFDCPMCKHHCNAEGGCAEVYKTDFHMKSLLEFIQLQRTFEQKDGRECVGCSQKKKVEAYCFECEDFLCNQCHQFHTTNKMFSKHTKHVLNVKGVGAKGLTLEKLASLTSAPRCTSHTEHVAQLLCSTCGNVPICVACTLGKHKGHEFHEVTTLATAQRENLTKKLEELEQCKGQLYELPQKIESVRRKLKENVLKEKQRLREQHEKQVKTINEEVQKNAEELEKRKADVTKKKGEECRRVRTDYEARICRLREECEQTVQDTERKYDSEVEHAEEEHDKTKAELVSGRGALEGDLNDSIERIEERNNENKEELEKISEHISHTINRYENVAATSSAVLASKNDWLEAQSIPDIGAAFEPLITDVKKVFPKLDSLSDLPPRNSPKAVANRVTVTDREMSVIDFKGGKEWNHMDLTTCGDGDLVITSQAQDVYSYLTILNTKGQVLRQKKMKRKKGNRNSWRFCCKLTESKIATVMQNTEIGIFDTNDGSYFQETFAFNGTVSCITTDPTNGNILVGCYWSNSIDVFDNKLKHLYKLVLPSTPVQLCDISICGRTLLVCEYISGRAYAAAMEGRNVRLLHEFTKPHNDKYCSPMSVCSDESGFIYILWGVVGMSGRSLTQYTRDGHHQLLPARPVDDNARRVRVLEDKDGERLLVLTISTGKVFVYGLDAC